MADSSQDANTRCRCGACPDESGFELPEDIADYEKRRFVGEEEFLAERDRADRAEQDLERARDEIVARQRDCDEAYRRLDASREIRKRAESERDAAEARATELAAALKNTTRELEMWHDERPDPTGPLRDLCVTHGYIEDAKALLSVDGPGRGRALLEIVARSEALVEAAGDVGGEGPMPFAEWQALKRALGALRGPGGGGG